MADFIIITGDKAMFNPLFGQAIVTARPGDLIGTGKDKVNQKLVCVDGDEKKVIVPGCPYMTPQYSIPGMGMLTIESLAGNQKAKKTKSGGKPVLLKGASLLRISGAIQILEEISKDITEEDNTPEAY